MEFTLFGEVYLKKTVKAVASLYIDFVNLFIIIIITFKYLKTVNIIKKS